jgi:hypothetical protein
MIALDLRKKLKMLLDEHHLVAASTDRTKHTSSIKGTCRHGNEALLWSETDVPEYETLDKHAHEFVSGWHPERGDWQRMKGMHVEVDEIHEVLRTGVRERADGLCCFCGRGDVRERESFLGEDAHWMRGRR